MKIIDTKGITYLETFHTGTEWYWGTDYACGDLYEAEEVFLAGKRFEPNRLIFVHYPDGKVFEPIKAKENQYFGNPICMDGVIYILVVHFDEKVIRIFRCLPDMKTLAIVTEISLNEVKDCYNLRLEGTPMMLIRQGSENHFQIIWPEKVDFVIGDTESFLWRDGKKLYFSEWNEDESYREEVNVRAYPTGNLIEKIPGTVMTMPDEQNWILR